MFGVPFISLQTMMNAQRQLNPWPSRDKMGLISRKTRSLEDKARSRVIFVVEMSCCLILVFPVSHLSYTIIRAPKGAMCHRDTHRENDVFLLFLCTAQWYSNFASCMGCCFHTWKTKVRHFIRPQ